MARHHLVTIENLYIFTIVLKRAVTLYPEFPSPKFSKYQSTSKWSFSFCYCQLVPILLQFVSVWCCDLQPYLMVSSILHGWWNLLIAKSKIFNIFCTTLKNDQIVTHDDRATTSHVVQWTSHWMGMVVQITTAPFGDELLGCKALTCTDTCPISSVQCTLSHEDNILWYNSVQITIAHKWSNVYIYDIP